MKLNTPILTFAGAAALAFVSLIASNAFGYFGLTSQPIFTEDTPCNAEFITVPGQQVCFNVSAFDPNQVNTVVLAWNDIPITATTTPPCPTAGQGFVTTQFCFTPQISDAGQTFLVIFTTFIPGLDQIVPKCDIKITVEPDLSAEVTKFIGASAYLGGPVNIQFETSSEIDNAFFNIYRGEGNQLMGSTLVNKSPIMAMGGPAMPASYTQLDRKVVPGKIYHYWLESVDIYGESQVIGPISVAAR
ncbi:MAG: hypothetical protein HY286_07165 [Planctomycetes bacterium]|nr:hypothetical protein [Planctomycetota bacterium]